VTGSALSWHIVLSRCDVITVMRWQRFTVEVVLKVISVGTPAIRHTGCPRMNMPDFGRVFLMLKYTDITKNTYVQS